MLAIYAALMQSLSSMLSAGLDCKYYILFCVNDFKQISNLSTVIKKLILNEEHMKYPCSIFSVTDFKW